MVSTSQLTRPTRLGLAHKSKPNPLPRRMGRVKRAPPRFEKGNRARFTRPTLLMTPDLTARSTANPQTASLLPCSGGKKCEANSRTEKLKAIYEGDLVKRSGAGSRCGVPHASPSPSASVNLAHRRPASVEVIVIPHNASPEPQAEGDAPTAIPSMRGILSSGAVQVLVAGFPTHPPRLRLRSTWPIVVPPPSR